MTWSTTVIMKIDLAGPRRRGLAMGLNEAAGYGAVAVTALATGYLAARYGMRPAPFYLGVAYGALGLGLSTLGVRETHRHAQSERGERWRPVDSSDHPLPSGLHLRSIFVQTSLREPALSSACQAGMVNNLNDGLAWGLFPLLFASAGLSVGRIGILAALYPAVWGMGQLVTGALSDRIGRKRLIVVGMLTQALSLAAVAAADSFVMWSFAATLLGAGTAMVYPTLLAVIGDILLAVIGDIAHPEWRARAVGTYRLWRDLGFVVGAVLSGVLADLWGVRSAVWTIAGLTAASGLFAAARMYETMGPRLSL
jgi:MFS family permease